MPKVSRIQTLGALKASGYRPRSVKQELRDNLRERLACGGPLFPGILGYDRTVIPAVVNALLAGHDFILLGLRGQAKTRILRSLTTLLDAEVPMLAGSELNDDPLAPISIPGQRLVAAAGDDAPIEWLGRDERYNEKLATPDVSIADLLGDIDPIKAATRKLTFADPEVIHFGIVPRTNRGIFAINELPDLSPRIQVGLFNILEERDLQIRGFPVRIPLDLLMVFSANPEDYTNRGSIITPLKDRISSQILTHYPPDTTIAADITRQEAWTERDVASVVIPEEFRLLVEDISFAARESDLVDQSSGVSARVAISALELLASNLERRALALPVRTTQPARGAQPAREAQSAREAQPARAMQPPRTTETAPTARTAPTSSTPPAAPAARTVRAAAEAQAGATAAEGSGARADGHVYPRLCDLQMLLPAITGKVEMVYEGEQQGAEVVARRLIGLAVKKAFDSRFPEVGKELGSGGEDDKGPYAAIVHWFAEGNSVTLSDEQSFEEYEAEMRRVPGLAEIAARHGGRTREERALAGEMVLEGLHQHLKLGRNDLDSQVSYKEMIKFQLLKPRGGSSGRRGSGRGDVN